MEMTWPGKIFIESTALFQLGPRLENVDFARLLELRNLLEFELFVTELNFREYLRFRDREIRQILSSVKDATRDLEKYGQNYSEFEPLTKRIEAFLPNIEKHFREKFETIGIQILPTPKLETEKLVQMSLEGTPPFEPPKKHPNEKSSEKGFRDAIAMFTVLQAMESEEVIGLVITDDDRLTEGFALHAFAFGATINCVDGIPAANKHIEKELTASYRDQLRKQSEEAKSFLLQNEGLLKAKIAEIQELESLDFGGLFGVVKDESGNSLSILKVLSLEFVKIETALWKDRHEEHSRILFRLKCEARSLVQRNFFLSQYVSRKYPLGRPPVSAYSGTPAPETGEMQIPVWLYGEASVTKAGSGWQIDELKIDRRVPDKDDFYELLSIGLNLPEIRSAKQ